MNHAEILERVSLERLKHDIFYLCREPFPFRTVKYTIPWHEKNSLDESDEFIAGEMPWNFADFATCQGPMRVGGNRKGLFTRDRRPKMAAHWFRERWKKL